MNGWKESIKLFFRGGIRSNELLAPHTSMRVGGRAGLLFQPADTADLAALIRFLGRNGKKVYVLGAGSNLLISEEDAPEFVAKLDAPFFKIMRRENDTLFAAAGVMLASLLEFTRREALAGAEFLAGIPGTLGGALLMNAGARGLRDFAAEFHAIGELVEKAQVMDHRGNILVLERKNIGFAYRNSGLKEYIVLGAWLKLRPERRETIEKNMREFLARKQESQELCFSSAGCVFKNPLCGADSAGRLIEQCRLKGKSVGGAQVSRRHANFIVNRGRARFTQIRALMRMIQWEVEQKFNVRLEPEVQIWEQTLSDAPKVRIAVLMGGFSSEREISLRSGAAVSAALRGLGYPVTEIDVHGEPELSAMLRNTAVDCCFNTLHGRFGEDGGVQELLERLGIVYTGSGARASRLAMNKPAARRLFEKQGLAVPETFLVRKGTPIPRRLPFAFPVVVKPAREGSSIGLTIAGRESELVSALGHAFEYDTTALVERFIDGREITVGILDERPLPVIEVVPRNKFYDFQAKYTPGMTQYLVPAALPEEVYAQAQKAALQAHTTLDCRGFSRVDMIIDAENKPVILEVNTIPGMTVTSLLPKAAAACGISFERLCEKMILCALAGPHFRMAAGERGEHADAFEEAKSAV